MSYRVEFSSKLLKLMEKYKRSNPSAAKKLRTLLGELAEHPRTGTGHPEPLREGGGITYSRRITASDRLIYDIYDDVVTVMVIAIGGHYGDK